MKNSVHRVKNRSNLSDFTVFQAESHRKKFRERRLFFASERLVHYEFARRGSRPFTITTCVRIRSASDSTLYDECLFRIIAPLILLSRRVLCASRDVPDDPFR